jgi:hypothetical protein
MEKEWLRINSGILRISEIEKVVGCPVRTITKWVSGERELPVKWSSVLDAYVKELCGGVVGVDKAEQSKKAKQAKEAEESPGVDGVGFSVQNNTSIISEDRKTVIDIAPEELKENTILDVINQKEELKSEDVPITFSDIIGDSIDELVTEPLKEEEDNPHYKMVRNKKEFFKKGDYVARNIYFNGTGYDLRTWSDGKISVRTYKTLAEAEKARG